MASVRARGGRSPGLDELSWRGLWPGDFFVAQVTSVVVGFDKIIIWMIVVFFPRQDVVLILFFFYIP